MPTFTYPGVYIEELSSGVHAIAGVATSIGAFIGWAPRGPVNEAVLVQSWLDFEAIYGGLDARSLLGYSVNQFFANGGQQTYIVRLVWDGSLPSAPGTDMTASATAVAAGVGSANATISASVGSIAAPPVPVGVGASVLQGIGVGPVNLAPIPLGASLQFTATGSFSDGTTGSPAVVWTSSNMGIVSILPSGVATGAGVGSAVLTATSGLISGSVSVTVTASPLNSITVAPAGVSLGKGQTLQFTATGTYLDGTTKDFTGVVQWSSSAAAEASVVASGAGAGVVTAEGSPGAPTITASWAGVSGSQAVTITAAVPTAISIFPAAPVLELAGPETATFSATAQYSDGSSAALGGVTWTNSNSTVASLAGAVATAAAAGVTTITGTVSGLTASATLTVTNATLKAITLTPLTPTVAQGQSTQLRALGIYSDGTSADLTESATWSTASPDVTVNAETGIVTGVTVVAAAAVKAQWQATSASINVAVTAPVLLSLAITPARVSLLPGQTANLTATGIFSSGPPQNLTTSATWSSSSAAVATVTPTGPGAGFVSAIANGGTLTLFAANPGAWGNYLQVSVAPLPTDATRFGLLVQQTLPGGQTQTLESFNNLSVKTTDPNYVVTVIDNDSQYLSFIDPQTNAVLPPTGTPVATASPIALGGGADGSVLEPASDQNFENVLLNSATAGLQLLNIVDIFNLLCVPGETDGPTISQLQSYCAGKRAFYIVDSPQFTTLQNMMNSGPVGSTTGPITGAGAQNSAFYFPWVQAPDPLFGNRPTYFPPCGFVAGIYASTDASRGVWKAPAGINAALAGVTGLQFNLTDLENGTLNIQAVNCLRQFKVYGDVVWGARTLAGNDQAGSEWKYVPIRRLALYIESSLYDGTQWVVFEPNDAPLWSQIRLNVGAFLQGLFLQGAFQGTSPQQAYFVKCDADNNPQSSIDLGIVNILVGFAPLYPAEFVVIQIQQMAGQSA